MAYLWLLARPLAAIPHGIIAVGFFETGRHVSDQLIFALAVLIFVALVFFVLVIRFPEVIREFFPKIKRIKFGLTGIEIDRAVDTAKDLIADREGREADETALREEFTKAPKAARILWVDDNPDNNRREISVLTDLGMEVETAKTNDEAMDHVRRRRFNLVLSDIGRGPGGYDKAGLDLPKRLREVGTEDLPIIYYTRHADAPTTPGGDPVVDEPSSLFRLVIRDLAARA